MRYLKASWYVGVALVLLSAATIAQRTFDVRWANERVTLHAVNAPIAEVMTELARLAGFEIVGGDKLTGQVSVDVADMPLKDALARILANANYVIQERPGAQKQAAPQVVVSVHSMAGYALPTEVFSGPIEVPALDALAAKEAEDAQDEKDQEAEDDPDAYLEEIRQDKQAAAQLSSEGAFGPKASLTSLVTHAENYYNDEIRIEAIKALGTRPLHAVLPVIAKALGDESWEVRNVAIDILTRSTDRESLHVVGQLLEKSKDIEVRVSALRILARRADPESAPHLRAVLKDPDEMVRESAVRLLTEIDRRERLKEANRQ